jgi:HlyD family secretion protein
MAGVAATVLVWIAMRPQPIVVDVDTVSSGPMVVTLDEEGETRIRHRFVVSAPATGRIERIDLEPGDRVVRGKTVLVRVRPEMPPLLDARTRADAEAAVTIARAAAQRAAADVQRLRVALDRAERELARERELVRSGLTSVQVLEAREADEKSAQEAVRAAEYALASAQADVTRAQIRLQPGDPSRTQEPITIVAPVDGVVLRRLRESASLVPAGEPLLELGDPTNLEVVADLLSTDAVKVTTGAQVRLADWGGAATLLGRVRRVEPSGFTKVSALGVEEQRVNVLVDLEDPTEASTRLGDGFRTEIQVVLWESPNALQAPTAALFRHDDGWAVYVIDGDRARVRRITIGQQTPRSAQVIEGLTAGETVVVHPPDTLADGALITRR